MLAEKYGAKEFLAKYAVAIESFAGNSVTEESIAVDSVEHLSEEPVHRVNGTDRRESVAESRKGNRWTSVSKELIDEEEQVAIEEAEED